MNNKKIISILALFLVLFIAIGAASAADDIAVSDVDDGSDISVNVLNDVKPNGNFTDLQSAIDGASGTLELDRDYVYNADSDSAYVNGVVINSPLTIDGKNHILDGSNLARIFNIKSDNVILKNINFVNGNHNGNGAAIDVYGATTISGCNFTNNHVNLNAGAVNFQTGSKGTVENCIFTNNRADAAAGGGAIYSYAVELEIIGSTFKNNYAGSSGSAIYSVNSITIDGCSFDSNEANDGATVMLEYENSNSYAVVKNTNFTNNKAKSVGGLQINSASTSNNLVENCRFENNQATTANVGGLYMSVAGGKVINCVFNNNSAKTNSGAASLKGTIEVRNCNFTDNSAAKAGAIRARTAVTVDNCSFINNTANGNGGAIYAESGSFEVTDSTFTNNTAKGAKTQGGAIYLDSENAVIDKCTFLANAAATGWADNEDTYGGGSIYINAPGCTVSNSKFSSNGRTTEIRNGGAISVNGANAKVLNCEFSDLSASLFAGGICVRDNGTGLEITDCKFTNIKGNNGGALTIHATTTIDNCTFDNCTAYFGNAILAGIGYHGQDVDFDYLTLNDCTFTNCYTTNVSGTISNGALDIQDNAVKAVISGNTLFENCSVVDKSGSGTGGGAIYSKSDVTIEGTLRIIGCNCTEGKSKNGGAIVNRGTMTVKGVLIIENCAADKGGAIFNMYSDDGEFPGVFIVAETGSLTITGCNATYGGAVYVCEGASFTVNGEAKFINNTAQNPAYGEGGAAIRSLGSLSLNNCLFEDNSINWTTNCMGGAIYQSGGDYCNIINTKFINNGPNPELFNDNEEVGCAEGGAVSIYGTPYLIDGCTFEGNTGRWGILSTSEGATGEIKNTVFDKNYVYQGTLTLDGGVTLTNVNITNNVAELHGSGNLKALGSAVILWCGEVIVDNCNIINNTDNNATTSNGNVFYVYGTDCVVTIKNSLFENNSAVKAAAINNKGTLTIENTVFNNNKATAGDGGAIINNGICTITDSKFINNTAQSGGAIYVAEGASLKADNVKFINNTVTPPNVDKISAGAAICSYGNIVLGNCLFDANKVNWTSNTCGGAIYQSDDADYCNMTNCNFLNNGPCPQLFNNNEEVGCTYGGAIFIAAKHQLIDNCSFDNNTGRWGVLYLQCTDCIINNTLITNSYLYQGNLYLLKGDFKVYNTNITNSVAELHGSGSLKAAGSAVMIYTTAACEALFENCKFVNNTDHGNTSLSNGGTFYIVYPSNVNVLIKYSLFKDNSAVTGGALYLDDGIVTIENTVFENNKATAKTGGAIYSYSGRTLTVNDCTFKNNFANQYGGAIYNIGSGTKLEVNNSNFTGCSASMGGAIMSWNNAIATVSDCTFTDCKNVINNNAAGTFTLKDSVITGSTGTLITNANIFSMDNVTIKNNKASTIISSSGSKLTINNTNIIDNTATGFVVKSTSTITTINNTVIEGNVIGTNCVVYLINTTSTIENTVIANNTVIDGQVLVATGTGSLKLISSDFIANKKLVLLTANGESNGVNAVVISSVNSVVSGNTFEDNANKCIFHNLATADFGQEANTVVNNGEMKADSIDGYIENDGTIVGGTTELIDKHVSVVVKNGTTEYEVGFVGRLATEKGKVVINDNKVDNLKLSCEGEGNDYTLADTNITDDTEAAFASYKVEDGKFTPAAGHSEVYVNSLKVGETTGESEYNNDSGEIIAKGGSLTDLQAIINMLNDGETLTIFGNYSYDPVKDAELTGIVINKNINIASNGNNSITAGELGTLFVVGDDVSFGLSDLTVVAKDDGIAIDMKGNTNNVVALNGVTFDGDNVTVVNLGSTSTLSADNCIALDSAIQYAPGATIIGEKLDIFVAPNGDVYDITAEATVGGLYIKGLEFNFTSNGVVIGAANDNGNGAYYLDDVDFGYKVGTFVVSADLEGAEITNATVTRGVTIWIVDDYTAYRGQKVNVTVGLDNKVSGTVVLYIDNFEEPKYYIGADQFVYNATDKKYYYTFEVDTSEYPTQKYVADRAALIGASENPIKSAPKIIYLKDLIPVLSDVNVTGNYSEKVNITFTVINGTDGDKVVLHLVDGENITGTVASGKVLFTDVVLPFAGIYNTDAIYMRGTETLTTANVNWNISKITTDITFNPVNVTGVATGNNTVVITVTDVYGNVVKQGQIRVTGTDGVTLDHTDGIYNLTDGVATVKFSYPEAGNYQLSVEYLGGVATNNTDNYYTSTKDLTVVIGQAEVTITVDESKRDVSGKVNDTITITGTVKDQYGNVPTGNVTIEVNGKTFTAVVGEDGTYSLSFNSTESGKWTNVPVKFVSDEPDVWDDATSVAPDVVKITINKLHTNIVSNYTFVGDDAFNGTYGEQMTLNFTVFDENGKLVKDGQLIFWFNGVQYTTNVVDGYASITNPAFVWTSTGLYNYVVDYVNNGKVYYDSFNFTNVNIPKIATKIAINTTVNDETVKDGKITIKFNVTDVDGKVPVSKGVIYYVTPDGIEHSANVGANGVVEVTVDVNRTGTYYIAVSYYDLDGDFLYSEADFTWDVQLTSTLIKVTKEGNDLIATINVGDELGNTADGKLDLFVNGKLMSLNVVNGLASVNLGAYNGPVEINAVFTGADGLVSSDSVIVELASIPENDPASSETLEKELLKETEDVDKTTTEDVDEAADETVPEDVENEPTSDDSGAKETAVSAGIPMQSTAIPILALLIALITLPFCYRRD